MRQECNGLLVKKTVPHPESSHVCAGLVIQPLDLLAFDEKDRTIIEHAFGSMLIAADAQTAAELATRHGLASVTLDGKISRPGSLQGGWQGSGPRSQTASTVLEVSNIRVRAHRLLSHMPLLWVV